MKVWIIKVWIINTQYGRFLKVIIVPEQSSMDILKITKAKRPKWYLLRWLIRSYQDIFKFHLWI